jgi:excisionase family DNA binding protein
MVQLLTGQEVADQLRITLNTLYRLADAGEIRCIRVGVQRRFHPQAVEDYLNRAEPVDAA